MLLLRAVHIIFGVMWVGGVFFLAFFVLPSARAVGPAAGPFVGHLTQVKQVPRVLLYLGLITIVAGFWMYWLDSAGANPEWMKSNVAKTYGLGGVFALVAWFIGMILNAPLAKKIGAYNAKLAASGAPPTDADKATVGAMQAKLAQYSMIATVLLLLATACMAVARYIP
jgi:hypothetical protein